MLGWKIPRCFEGGVVAVLASGPSMSQAVADAVHIAGIPAIAINTTHRLAPWAWMLYAADTEWWQHPTNRDAQAFKGLRVTCSGQAIKGVHRIMHSGVEGFSTDQACVHTHGNSGAQAMQIAVKTGAARVLLLGMDMHGGHWHGEHPPGLRSTVQELYSKWARRTELAAPAILATGVDVVNCTPGSALKCFRMSTLDQELKSLGLAWPVL